MSRLLSADFSRLRKDLLFWICVIVMFLFAVTSLTSGFINTAKYTEPQLWAEKVLFGFNLPVGIFCAAFCSLFQSEEYSGGTVRNKLVVGHSRASVYLSSTVTCMAAAVIMCLAYLIPAVISLPFLPEGFRELTVGEAIGYIASGLLLAAECAAIFCMITVIFRSKAASSAACFFVVLLIIWVSRQVYMSLHLPEYTYLAEINARGRNPLYLEGTERTLNEIILEILPAGQAWQLYVRKVMRLPLMLVSSAVISVISLIAGTAVFVKRDIK